MLTRPWPAEVVFPTLLAAFGLLYAAALPPCQAPDENKHFLRAYHVSEGHLRPELVDEGWVGGDLPESIGRFADALKYLRHHPEERVGTEAWRSLAHDSLAPGRRRATPFEGAESYLFVAYLPQAAGMALGRLAGLNPLGLLYAGRLANLVLATAVLALAIRAAPLGKAVFGAVALLPVSVQQMASLSPDASALSASFLLTALLLRAALTGLPAGWRLISRAAGLAAWVTACRANLAPLVLLALAVPRKVLGSWAGYLAGVVLMSAAVLLPYAVLARNVPESHAEPPRRDLPEDEVSYERQMQIVRGDPLRFLGVVANTCWAYRQRYLDFLFMLGWLDTQIPPAFAYPYALVLVFLALAGPAPPLPYRLRAALLAVVLTCALVIFLALYLSYTAPGAPLIKGVQGRYFIPLLPPALLLLSNRLRFLRVGSERLMTLAVAAAVVESPVALGAIVARYYLPPSWQLSAMGVAALVGAVGGVAVWLVRRRRWSGPKVIPQP